METDRFFFYLLRTPKLLIRWEGSEWWQLRFGLSLYTKKFLQITTIPFPFHQPYVHLPLRSGVSVYINLILNLSWCCGSFFVSSRSLCFISVESVLCGVVKTHTHIPIDTCKCSLFRMQIRNTVKYLCCIMLSFLSCCDIVFLRINHLCACEHMCMYSVVQKWCVSACVYACMRVRSTCAWRGPKKKIQCNLINFFFGYHRRRQK